jgi:hypothetical protein
MKKSDQAALRHAFSILMSLMNESHEVAIEALLLVLSAVAADAGMNSRTLCNEVRQIHKEMLTCYRRKPSKKKPRSTVLAYTDTVYTDSDLRRDLRKSPAYHKPPGKAN